MAKKNTIKIDPKKTVKKEGETAVKEDVKTLAAVKAEKPAVKKEEVKPVVVKEVKSDKTEKKPVVKEEKETKVEAKATAKKIAVKKETKKEVKAVEKATPVKKVTKTEATVVKAVKDDTKVEAKKAAVKPVAKKTVSKAAEKPVAKTAKAKEEVKEKAVVKSATKQTKAKVEAKPTAKKAVAKTTAKAPVKKAASKKAAPKKQALSKYDEVSLDACLNAMHTMGVGYEYNDYYNILMDEADLSVVEKNIIAGNKLADKHFDFAKDGYDLDVVMATLVKVVATMDVSASEFKTIKKNMDACVKTKLVVDADENSKNYLAELRVAEKVLMVGQRKNITTTKEISDLLNSDVNKFFAHFKNMAYTVLKNWKYEDVEFYQEFAFAFVSQFTDMFTDYQNEIQMDCADLYILHGDEGRGDHEYNYVLRENEIKDYIYYRFANVYVERNLGKAKSIAQSAFQWVDDRYDYFKKIVEIIEK